MTAAGVRSLQRGEDCATHYAVHTWAGRYLAGVWRRCAAFFDWPRSLAAAITRRRPCTYTWTPTRRRRGMAQWEIHARADTDAGIASDSNCSPRGSTSALHAAPVSLALYTPARTRGHRLCSRWPVALLLQRPIGRKSLNTALVMDIISAGRVAND